MSNFFFKKNFNFLNTIILEHLTTLENRNIELVLNCLTCYARDLIVIGECENLDPNLLTVSNCFGNFSQLFYNFSRTFL